MTISLCPLPFLLPPGVSPQFHYDSWSLQHLPPFKTTETNFPATNTFPSSSHDFKNPSRLDFLIQNFPPNFHSSLALSPQNQILRQLGEEGRGERGLAGLPLEIPSYLPSPSSLSLSLPLLLFLSLPSSLPPSHQTFLPGFLSPFRSGLIFSKKRSSQQAKRDTLAFTPKKFNNEKGLYSRPSQKCTHLGGFRVLCCSLLSSQVQWWQL